MKHCLLYLLLFLLCLGQTNAQVGSASQPFLSLSQARTVTGAGVYHFTISGTSFSTYVDADGYVQIALDFGNGAGTLPASASLTTTDRGILPAATLAVLTEMNEVRISCSRPGSLDAVSFEPEYVNRVTTNTTLMNGTADNPFNDGWTGTGAAQYLLVNSTTTRPHVTLAQEVFHTYGDANGLHWFSERGDQGLGYTNEIAASEKFTLWVRAPQAAAGSASNPFTSLKDAVTVPSAGIYHFYLSGVSFSTFVDAAGYVQVAVEFGADAAAALPQSTDLTATARGILTPEALAVLTEMTEVRMSSSDLTNLNATTENPGVFNKILTNDAIKADYLDDAINADWEGTGSTYLTGPGGDPNTNGDRPLHEEIFHNYYNTGGMHWIPYRGDQALTYTNNVAATESYTLWVRAVDAVLPLQLGRFTGVPHAAGVRLWWEIVTPDGGAYIDLERSRDGQRFQFVDRIDLEQGQEPITYEYLDPVTEGNILYYRLRQTDWDGFEDFSPVLAVRMPPALRSGVSVYPNPTSGVVTVKGATGPVTVLDASGQMLPDVGPVGGVASGSLQLDLSGLPRGIYFVLAGGEAYRIVRK